MHIIREPSILFSRFNFINKHLKLFLFIIIIILIVICVTIFSIPESSKQLINLNKTELINNQSETSNLNM